MKKLKLFFTGLLLVLMLPAHAEFNDGKLITVKTDTIYVEINTIGGDIQHLSFLRYPDELDINKPFVLFEKGAGTHNYVAQTGLLGSGMPNHHSLFVSEHNRYELKESAEEIDVCLIASTSTGGKVTKRFTFYKGSYLIDVTYEIENRGTTALLPTAYFHLVRDSVVIGGSSKLASTYIGPAVYTEKGKLQKIMFSDIEKNKINLPRNPDNGWIGMLQPDFVSAWLPTIEGDREYYIKKLDGNIFAAGVLLPVATIEPGQFGQISILLYAGPANSTLNKIAPGLGLSCSDCSSRRAQ